MSSSSTQQGAPALSVFGGKLTTYRRLAEAALARLAAHLPGMAPPWTSHAMLPGDEARLSPGAGEFAPGLGRAEVEYLMREEWARTAADVLWRRTKAGLAATTEQRAALTRLSREPGSASRRASSANSRSVKIANSATSSAPCST